MTNKHLATYLNDHLAGSTMGIELIDLLEKTVEDADRERVFADLKVEVSADRDELRAMMGSLEVAESPPRKIAGWLAEKGGELKLAIDDKAGGDLHRMEALEALSLGIEGKLGLWKALETVAGSLSALEAVDFPRLKRRAEEQHSQVEAMRLEAAQAALT